MREIRTMIFGAVTFSLVLMGQELLEASVSIKGRSKSDKLSKDDLHALYQWLGGVFIPQATSGLAIVPVVGSDVLAARQATAKGRSVYETENKQTNLKSLGLEVFDRSKVKPEA